MKEVPTEVSFTPLVDPRHLDRPHHRVKLVVLNVDAAAEGQLDVAHIGGRGRTPAPGGSGDGCPGFGVPGQILIAFVAKLKRYGFWPGEGRFAELLRILEKEGATGWGGSILGCPTSNALVTEPDRQIHGNHIDRCPSWRVSHRR